MMLSDAESLERRLRYGRGDKAVFVRGREIEVVGARTASAERLERSVLWSLAGIYHRYADPQAVLDDVRAARDEQRELARAIRNYDVRA